MWRMAWSELMEHARWIGRHPLQAGLVLTVCLFGAVKIWLDWRPQFIDLDKYYLETAAGRAELPGTVGGVFVLGLADGRRLPLLCDVVRGRRASIQGCIHDAVETGLRDDEPVTVHYLRPPRKGWDHPILLSIQGQGGVYLSCRDRLRALELRHPSHQALCG